MCIYYICTHMENDPNTALPWCQDHAAALAPQGLAQSSRPSEAILQQLRDVDPLITSCEGWLISMVNLWLIYSIYIVSMVKTMVKTIVSMVKTMVKTMVYMVIWLIYGYNLGRASSTFWGGLFRDYFFFSWVSNYYVKSSKLLRQKF